MTCYFYLFLAKFSYMGLGRIDTRGPRGVNKYNIIVLFLLNTFYDILLGVL